MAYDFKTTEAKWRLRWEKIQLGEVDTRTLKEKFYILTMFPYPSGDRLHMGHWYQYGIVDSWARFKRMTGKKVYQPMGFDAFGLPAENFAIKNGTHPDISTSKNVEIMIRQFKEMGVSYAWSSLLNTSKPNYYRWTQWLFLQLYKKGLAYRKNAPVNWCPSCQTVLANEQVQEGQCERCETLVTQRNLQQWFFKITDYSERLLAGIPALDWPERTKAMQTHWIGRSEGAEVDFKVEGAHRSITVFTTRPDTLFGVTYVVLAPEHPLVCELTDSAKKSEMEKYLGETKKLSELDRQSSLKKKTGMFTGSYAINPVNGQKIPVWVADYVLGTYGSGAVMAVPAHDERDFAFARSYGLPIVQVIVEPGKKEGELPEAFTGEGKLTQSGKYTGMDSAKALPEIIDDLEASGIGRRRVNFRLRDWLISRQRYWGTPIPIVYCAKCGEVPVPEAMLPVELPKEVDFKPTGESPLRRCASFLHTKCPQCGGAAEREADTLDTFVCSSWYFLRFPNVGDDSCAFDPMHTNRMLPVDRYVGGAEHACMHLLYARFVTMALKDLGLLAFEEPFPHLTHQGLVLGSDGQKMSKSKGNAVSPDPYVEAHGSDALRLYLMFGFNYIDGGPWEDGGFKAVLRFLDRLGRLFEENEAILRERNLVLGELSPEDKKLLLVFHQTIQRMTADMDRFQFNTSIARMMELLNAFNEYARMVPAPSANGAVVSEVLRTFIVLLAPFAPHFSEEYWERAGGTESVFNQPWPVANPKFMASDTIAMAVMINGKLRDEITVSAEATADQVREAALAASKIAKYVEGQSIVKVIHVPKKLINFIIKPA